MPGLLTGPGTEGLQRLLIPCVCVLIAFLAYTSQWLFNSAEYLEPGPMTKRETYIFNVLVLCVWVTYYKACTVPAGRYIFPPSKPSDETHNDHKTNNANQPPRTEPSSNAFAPNRWCKKCSAPKPLRAHHCRHCGTCIPKMDHHCPWTGNCVSLQTFPYFLRFLVYTNLALGYLHIQLLYPRFRFLFWDNSRLPSYLGPSVGAMIHLTLLGFLGGLASLALGVLLLTTFRSWVLNQTMIEGWEIERHDAVLLRAKRGGGWWTSPSSSSFGSSSNLRINRVEFPYDNDFFDNMAQAMGTKNILSWFDPLIGGGPRIANNTPGRGTGWEWEENGFNDREGMWPPPDPDKMRRAGQPSNRTWPGAAAAARMQEAESIDEKWRNPQEEVAAFKARQEMDLRRRRGTSGVIAELKEDEDLKDLDSGRSDNDYDYVQGREAYENDEDEDEDEDDDDDDNVVDNGTIPPVRGRPWFEQGIDGEPGWTNSEGDRLRDYGVDEEADDDEDVPLGELLRRRKAYVQSKM
ncbi:DHHC palmitoyltransferase-domain-containing protein [Coniella lustricola]|uniref:Palmitoyltransferase PFA4 n=1 Tax=Coniella lustricola TaxID=2025994 RepID=A0A2T3AFC9_9PEZI|nr:DHHC palmitoyltransferase-domain-containing protein [Coniella lustricola]